VTIRGRLVAALAYVVLLVIVAFGVPLAINLSARVNAEVRTQAQAQADLVAATAADLLTAARRPQLRALAASSSASVRGRVLIVNARGLVIADSAGPTEVGTSYESRPEIESALAGRQVQVQRTSKTLGQEILATAVPIIHDGRTAGAVRATQSVAAVHHAVLRVELALALIGAIVLALGLLAGGVLASQIARPLRKLEAVARRVAQGDLEARAQIAGSVEQRSLSRSFNEMTERIVLLLRAQRDFVADASHQLRTPLTGLRLRLEEARALSQHADATLDLDAAIGEVDRLAEIVDELLTLSRAEERQSTGTSVDLKDLAASATARWQGGARKQRIKLELQSHGTPGRAWAARADLERALDALIENALAYAPAGSTVTIATAPLRIDVRDRGPGVEEDERELVFERFHRGRTGRAGAPGHGLGLPIAREFARAWGGEISLHEADGARSPGSRSIPDARARRALCPRLTAPALPSTHDEQATTRVDTRRAAGHRGERRRRMGRESTHGPTHRPRGRAAVGRPTTRAARNPNSRATEATPGVAATNEDDVDAGNTTHRRYRHVTSHRDAATDDDNHRLASTAAAGHDL
jgi:signal transduction histidine kinase